ncbi:MAG: RAP domain-containing protein, partial [Candidatus Rickettsiella isopodorum]|nr:RAP domain-containing protein [Candidatus Rickettsiella isopodorum]
QDISNTLNALSKWPVCTNNVVYSEAIAALIQCIPQINRNFNAREISNTLNALSKWPECIEETAYAKAIDALVQCIPESARYFNTQAIPVILNALSKWPECINKVVYSEAIAALVQCIPQSAPNFNAQDISVTLNALSKWSECINKVVYSEAIDALVQCIPQSAYNFNAQDISNTLNALSKWPECINKVIYSEAFAALVQCILKRARDFNAQDISNILNAMSKWPELCLQDCLGYLKAINVLISCIPEKMDTFTTQIHQISFLTLTWCKFQFLNYSNAQWINKEEIIKKLIKNNETSIIKELNSITTRQFYQVYLFQPDLIPCRLRETIKCHEFESEEIKTSRLQNDVFQHLLAFFPEFKFVAEHFLEFTYVDIAWPEKKILIQVNGPSHYAEKKLNLSSQFNNHLFEKLGWSVVIIPYFDWKELIKDSARKKYLKRKLGFLIKQLSEGNAIKAAILYKNNEKSDINTPSIDDERKLVKLFNGKRPKTSLTLNDKEDNQYHKSSHQRFGKI